MQYPFNRIFYSNEAIRFRLSNNQFSFKDITYNFIKTETPTQMMSFEICESLNNTDMTEHLGTASS